MNPTPESETLTGQLLIAMPSMGDPRFAGSVVMICDHSADGAMGLVINKPAPELEFGALLEQLDITARNGGAGPTVHIGGPVDAGRGFVLHSPDYRSSDATLEISDGFGMTVTLDVIRDMAAGTGPERLVFCLGYSGWGPGQLEGELAENAWLTCAADPDIVFDAADDEKWRLALKSMGVDALLLSADGGRA